MEATFLFEHVSEAIVVTDRSFCIIGANPSFYKLFGVKERQALGKKICLLFRELHLSQCNEACVNGAGADLRGKIHDDLPEMRCPHLEWGYPIFDDSGKLQRITYILNGPDHAAPRGAGVNRTHAASSPKDMALSMIYHDLASPLQILRACIDVIEMEVRQNSIVRIEVIRDMTFIARRNERRLFEMVRTIRNIPQEAISG